jgi:cell division transport system permease protein
VLGALLGFPRFLAFSIGRAWRGFWRNALMSLAATATMVLMLVLLAGFWLVQAGLGAGLSYVEEKVEIVADLRDEPGAEDAVAVAAVELGARLLADPNVRAVHFLSKDEALARFRARLEERGQADITGFLDRNPLPASLEVKLVDARRYESTVETLRGADEIVEQVVEVKGLVERLTTVTGVLRTGGAVLLLLVGFTVLFIVVNTIRLAVVGRASEIEIMRLVGASDAFIRWPFIFEGAFVGLAGAVIALGLIALAAGPVSDLMYGFFRVLPIELGTLERDVVLLVFGTGVGLGTLGAWISVRSYLGR